MANVVCNCVILSTQKAGITCGISYPAWGGVVKWIEEVPYSVKDVECLIKLEAIEFVDVGEAKLKYLDTLYMCIVAVPTNLKL